MLGRRGLVIGAVSMAVAPLVKAAERPQRKFERRGWLGWRRCELPELREGDLFRILEEPQEAGRAYRVFKDPENHPTLGWIVSCQVDAEGRLIVPPR